jgi:hypothetical protein
MSTSLSDDLIPSAQLATEFIRLTGNPGPGVRKVLQLAADGRLPLEYSRGRWFARRSMLPELAHALGLNVRAAADDLQPA